MILFVVIPLVELAVILQIGGIIGAGWTIVLLVADSILGALLLRVQGRRVWTQFRLALEQGRWPGDEVAQGALVIVGGTLLLTPGFVTDVVGFLLLLGPTRRLVSGLIRRRITGGMIGGTRRPGDGGGSDVEGLDIEVIEIQREQRPPDPERSEDDPDGDR